MRQSNAKYLGAHVLLLARGKDTLESAKAEVSASRKTNTQSVDTIAADLTDPVAVSLPDC